MFVLIFLTITFIQSEFTGFPRSETPCYSPSILSVLHVLERSLHLLLLGTCWKGAAWFFGIGAVSFMLTLVLFLRWVLIILLRDLYSTYTTSFVVHPCSSETHSKLV